MRKDEFNDYSIKNPDGINPSKYNDGKVVYENDSSKSIDEYPANKVDENFDVKETFDSRSRKEESRKESKRENRTDSSSNVSQASTSASSAVSSTAASVSSSIGAFAGIVASAVVTAVIVVAVFISTMTMNLSLVLANKDSLTVQLDITGAQDEDFSEEIVAILESEDGEHQEITITKDSLYLTFNNLQPGKEYFIKVKNKDKVFVEKSFFTTTETIERGQVLTHYENNIVVVSAANVALKANEFYTITARDAQGNIVFTQDSKNPNEEFTFTVDSQTKLYFALTVNGATYTISELDPTDSPTPGPEPEPTPGPEPEPTPGPAIAPEYDYSTPEWIWADDYSSVTALFVEIHGLDPLVVQAEVSSEKTKYEDCENEGEISYYASLIESYGTYGDTKRVAIPALGHDYEAEFRWNYGDDPSETNVVITLCCTRNPLHEYQTNAEVSYTIDSTGQCGSDETTNYTATLVYEGKEYKETKSTTRTLKHEAATDAEITFQTSIDDKIDFYSGALSGSPKATYTCEHCGETVEESCVVEGKEFISNHVIYTVSCQGEQHEYEVMLQKTLADGVLTFLYDQATDSITVASFEAASTDATYSETSLNIPAKVFGKNVTKIYGNALSNTKYQTISMPDTITNIGDYAFFYCGQLTTITLSSGLTSIGEAAFEGCSLLGNVTLPEGLTAIGNNAFYYCEAIEEIAIPEGVTTIGAYAFCGCTSLASVSIPTSIRTVGANAFSGCSSITEIAFSYSSWNKPGVESIGTGAFAGCTSLQSLTIPVGAQDASTQWFGLYFGTSNSGIEDKVTACRNQSVSSDYYYIPNSLTHLTLDSKAQGDGGIIVDKEFYGITTIQTITFGIRSPSNPDTVYSYGVKEIGISSFEGCTGLTSVSLKNVKTFGSKAFKGCTGLTSITLDYDVSSIGQGFLEGCTSLVSLNVPYIGDSYDNAKPAGTNPEKTSDNFVLGYFFGTTSGSGLTAVQQKGSGSASLTTYYIPSGLSEISVGTQNTSYSTKAGIYYGAFMNCTMVTTVRLGPYITAIASDAFTGSGVTNLYFMSSDTYQVYDASGNSKGSYPPSALESASDNATTMKANTGYLWRIY